MVHNSRQHLAYFKLQKLAEQHQNDKSIKFLMHKVLHKWNFIHVKAPLYTHEHVHVYAILAPDNPNILVNR